jgi:N-acetylglucosamine transport system permease protein
MRPRNATSDLRRPWPLIVVFLAPALILYGTFFVYPMLHAILLSLYRGSPESGQYTYVGAENFRTLLSNDPMFWICVRHNLEFVVFAGTSTIVLALSLALALTRCGPGRSFFRVVFLFPNVMAVVAVAILWSFVFNPSFGVLNGLLRMAGLEHLARAWMGEPHTALPAIMVIQVWAQTGFYMVLFYAGLLRIPADYLEAARIDGANAFQEFRHVTLPLLSEILKIAVIYVIINSINVFALVFLVNEGTTAKYTNVLLTYLYESGFRNGMHGYACAIAVAMLVMVLGAGYLVNRLFRDKTVEL